MAPPGRADDDPPPDPQHREVRLPRIGPVRLVDQAGPDLADRAQTERLEMAERLGGLGHPALRGSRITRGQVGPDRRRPRWVDTSTEALVDELEGGLHRDPARSDAPEDLADRLDRLDVRLDRDLQPRVTVARGPGHPSPSFSRKPPDPWTSSPLSAASSVSSSRCRFESLVGTTTSTST